MLEAVAATVLSILSDRLSARYPLLPCFSTSAQNEEVNRRKQKRSVAFTKKSFSPKTQHNEDTTLESSSAPSPNSGQEGNGCAFQESQTSDETWQHHCVKDVRRFDRTVVLVLSCVKFYVCVIFAVSFALADDSAVDVIQCSDEYYFPE